MAKHELHSPSKAEMHKEEMGYRAEGMVKDAMMDSKTGKKMKKKAMQSMMTMERDMKRKMMSMMEG